MAVADVSSASSGATVSGSTLSRSDAASRPLTTPGWFRLAAVVLVAGLVALAVVSVRVVLDRVDATKRWWTRPRRCSWAPRTSTSRWPDADAAASTAFLRAGLEPPGSAIRYLADLETAGAELAHRATRSRGRPGRARRLQASPRNSPVYAGQVETARTNNRLDYPVGAAYLRRASNAMRDSILPAAKRSTTRPPAGCTTPTPWEPRVTRWCSWWRAEWSSCSSWPRRCWWPGGRAWSSTPAWWERP